MTRWNGSYVGLFKPTTLVDSGGVWNLKRQTVAKQSGIWPLDNSSTPVPTWSLNFSGTSEPWSGGADYTYISSRTNGTFIDSSGYVSVSDRNLILNSEVGNTGTGVSVTPNTVAAPDGTTTADTLTETSGNSFHHGVKNTLTIVPNTTYTVSMYVKNITGSRNGFFYISLDFAGNSGFAATFNLNDGTLGGAGSTSARGTPNGSRGIENIGNGWYRCWVTGTNDSTSTGGNIYFGATPSMTPTWFLNYVTFNVAAGDEKPIAYIWGFQWVSGSNRLPYSKTDANSNGIPRLTHNKNGNRLGLLIEESKTNLQLNSLTTSWSIDSATRTSTTELAPDNSNTATRIIDSSGSQYHMLVNDSPSQPSIANSTAHVYSCYLKAGTSDHAALSLWNGDTRYTAVFNVNSTGSGNVTTTQSSSSPTNPFNGIEYLNNGWYRCWIGFTSPSTGTNTARCFVCISNSATPSWGADLPGFAFTNSLSILCWGAQVETGIIPTSYIPTTSASITRNEDKVHIPKNKITNWASTGAICVHFYTPPKAGTLFSTDNQTNQQLGLEASSTTAARAFWSSGNTATGIIGDAGIVHKAIHYWDGTTSKFCINGSAVQTGTNNASSFTSIDFITLGAKATESSGVPGTFSDFANCIISKVEFYAGALTDSNLQQISDNNTMYGIQYLILAGGGGGGTFVSGSNFGGGGGGAGGYLESTSTYVIRGRSYDIVVGAGGAKNTSGSNSSFNGLTAIGGGGGGYNSVGSAGGSGGGGGGGNGTFIGGAATSGQGNAGGTGVAGWPYAGGGGGGANAAGTNGTSSAPGIGGNGKTSSITGTAIQEAVAVEQGRIMARVLVDQVVVVMELAGQVHLKMEPLL